MTNPWAGSAVVMLLLVMVLVPPGVDMLMVAMVVMMFWGSLVTTGHCDFDLFAKELEAA